MEASPMQSSKVRSRLKAQLTKFSLELSQGLSKPLQKFVGEMLFGIQASQDVKLSNIARSLKEEIPLIKTEDRLSRNLKAEELESELSERLAELGSRRVEANTVLCLDHDRCGSARHRTVHLVAKIMTTSMIAVSSSSAVLVPTRGTTHSVRTVPSTKPAVNMSTKYSAPALSTCMMVVYFG
jgi:hypothetical protein